MNKKIIAIIVLGLFVVGGLVMLGLGNKGGTSANTNQQGQESYDEMMARMHPSEQNNNYTANMQFSNAIGQQAPDFTLTKQDGSKFKLSDYQNKTVVLFFNEGSMCYPACWEQIASLGNDKRFNTGDIVSASIVVDTKEQWDRIIRSQPKYGSGNILFDTNKSVSNAYGVLNLPSSMHKGLLPGHTYVIIKKGIISYVLDDPNMALNNEVLASKL